QYQSADTIQPRLMDRQAISGNSYQSLIKVTDNAVPGNKITRPVTPVTVTCTVQILGHPLTARVLAGGPPCRYAREDAGWEQIGIQGKGDCLPFLLFPSFPVLFDTPQTGK
ncbi:MAG: hypothetical protein ACT4QE_04550, partial [Anaerolineales bacterium]